MKKIPFILALFISFISFAQSPQNNHWCFPYQAQVSFNTGSPVPGYCNNVNNFFVDRYGTTCASVSNSAGELQFYSDGVRIWDKNGVVMTHGMNIGGGPGTGWSEQGVIIVPKPGSETIYYVFTTCKFPEFAPANQNHTGFHYSVVDMSLRGTYGDVIEFSPGVNHIALKDDGAGGGNLIDYDWATNTGLQTFESSITSALNINNAGINDGIWVTIFTRFHEGGVVRRVAFSYLVKADGINGTLDGTSPKPNIASPLVVRCTSPIPICSDYGGSIKISPDGTHLCNEAKDVVDMYTFNNVTGAVTFHHVVFPGGTAIIYPGYGIEFSPNSSLIYFSSWECGLCQGISNLQDIIDIGGAGSRKNYIRIRQAKVTPQSEDDTPIIIGEFEVPAQSKHDVITPLPGTPYGELQLAPDGKIYACAFSSVINPPNANLGVINYPNTPGTGCQYANEGLYLASGTEQYGSLPQWVHKVPNSWPKVYNAGKGIYNLGKDNNGNLFATLGLVFDFTKNFNHIGILPPPPYYKAYTVQYTYSGITNWIKTNEFPIIALHTGDIQMYDQNSPFLFYNGVTGNPASPPQLAVPGEKIIAEVNNGSLITIDWHNNTPIYAHSLFLGTTTLNVVSPRYHKFNPTTNKLFIEDNTFKVYSFSPLNNNFNLIASVSLPVDPINGGTIHITQIDNQDKAYVVKDQMLQEFDYLANTYTPVTITGFNNTSIYPINSYNPYTEDRCLVSQASESNIYAIDFSTMTKKKVQHTKQDPFYSCYLFDGDNVFLGGIYTSPFTIGTQSIPIVSNSNPNSFLFLTKLSLQGDFNFSSSVIQETLITKKKPSFSAELSPNPINDKLQIEIKENYKQAKSSYTVSVINWMGSILFKKVNYTSLSSLNLSELKSGAYFVEIINDKGERISKNMIKL